MRANLLVLVALLLMLPLAATAFAGDDELTGQQVERYLAAMEDLRAFSREFDEGEGASDPEAEHARILERHGFSRDEWMALHERIFEAAVAVAVQREMDDEDLEQAFREQRERVREDPDIADDQRELMLEQIDDQLAAYRDMQDNPDTEVVEPYYDDFQEIFGSPQ